MFVENVAHIVHLEERAREGERESNTPRSTQTDHYEVHLPRHRLHYPFQSPSSRKLGRSVCTAVWAKSFRPALGDSLGSLGLLVAWSLVCRYLLHTYDFISRSRICCVLQASVAVVGLWLHKNAAGCWSVSRQCQCVFCQLASKLPNKFKNRVLQFAT